MWGHRIYRYILGQNEGTISFQSFIVGLCDICRSDNEELDKTIFKMFDLSVNQSFITLSDMTTMMINMPDMGFSNNQNINMPDKMYLNIKQQVIECVAANNLPEQQTTDEKPKNVMNEKNEAMKSLIKMGASLNLVTSYIQTEKILTSARPMPRNNSNHSISTIPDQQKQ